MDDIEPDDPPPKPSRRTVTFGWVRLALGVVSVALGVLPFVPAPNRLAWMISVGVNEWGHLVALLGLALLLPGWRRTAMSKGGALLGLVGVCLALSTIVRATLIADDVRKSCSFTADPRTIDQTPTRAMPFSLADVVTGISSPAVQMKTVTYVTRNNTPFQMDIYLPPVTGAAAPCVLMIHGGAWRTGTRVELPALNNYLAARGYVVASIDYRLAPESKFPAALDDVRAALDYLRDHAVELGLDPERIALFGRSAGGHLALLGGYKFEDNAIRGVVAIYAPTDLKYAYEHPSNPRVINTKEVLEDFLDGSPDSSPKVYEEASPIHFVKNNSPPTLLIHGDCDDVVYAIHSEMLDKKLKEHDVPHYLLKLPWGHHGCDANLNGPGGQISVYVIERFLATVMRKKVAE